jgi:hypothetical protein
VETTILATVFTGAIVVLTLFEVVRLHKLLNEELGANTTINEWYKDLVGKYQLVILTNKNER